MIIGIAGKAGVGKDTVAQILSKLKNMPIASFAQPLHEAAKFVFGDDCLERNKKEKLMPFGVRGFGNFYDNWLLPFLKIDEVQSITKNDKSFLHRPFPAFTAPYTGRFYQELSPRKFMQLLGTECFRFCKDDFFVRLMQNSYNNVIIPDVRFANEASICDLVVGIYRDVPSVNKHMSEEFADMLIKGEDDGKVGLVDVDGKQVSYLIIHNTQGIDELEQKLQKHVDFGKI